MASPSAVFRSGLAILALVGVVSLRAAEGLPDLSRYQPQPQTRLTHPDWARNAAIYELNTRQFTPEGTFEAARRELPRLRDLGIGGRPSRGLA